MEGNDEYRLPIYDTYRHCLRTFTACRNSTHLPEASRQLVESELNRFHVWAVNSSCCLTPSNVSSLDHRLRNSTHTRETVIVLMRILSINLDYARHIFTQPPEALKELQEDRSVVTGLALRKEQETQTQGGKNRTPLDITNDLDAKDTANALAGEALASAHQVISQLKRMLTAIRKATATEYNIEKARERDIKHGNDIRLDDEFAKALVDIRFPGAAYDLKEALINGISFRKIRFRDWKRHFESKKQSMVNEQATSSGSGTAISHSDTIQQLSEAKLGPVNKGPLSVNLDPVSLDTTSKSEASSFQSTLFISPETVGQPSATSTSVRSTFGSTYVPWPRPPKRPMSVPKTEPLRCPYCFDHLDDAEVRTTVKWRKHVAKDLEPYSCFEKECQEYLRLFSTESQWVNHVRVCHTFGTWVCRLKPHASSELFESEDDYRSHLVRDHDGMYPKSRISTMVKAAFRPRNTNVYQTCPMNCDFNQSSELGPFSLTSHIATHLLCLAMECLPERSIRSSDSGVSKVIVEGDEIEIFESGHDDNLSGDPFLTEDQINVLQESRDAAERDQEYINTSWKTERSLEDQLREVLQTRQGPGPMTRFLPVKQLQRLITWDNVIKELSKCSKLDESKIEEYAENICGKLPIAEDDQVTDLRHGWMRRIFAILVLMSRVKTIPDFIKVGVTDDDLPLNKYGESKGKFQLCRRNEKSPLRCFKSWKQDKVDRFYKWQWSLISPYFSKGSEEHVKYYNFEDEIILPWIFDSRVCNDIQDLAEVPGGYSVVWRVKIHPEHHDFHQICPADAGFAVKRLGSPKHGVFKNEVDMLEKFSHSPHQHLITLLATFKLRNQYYLLFPWAEGDLLNFWQDDMPDPSRDLVLSQWVCRQCFGLASGLASIHLYKPNYNTKDPGESSSVNAGHNQGNEKNHGRHGDIKPENVLRFLDPKDPNGLGVLQLSDFGLTVFNSRSSASGHSNQGVARTPTYRPPEADIKGGTVSRSWDIWALGCLYLEFLTWFLGGNELLSDFQVIRLSPDIWGATWLTDIYFEVVQTGDNSQANAIMVKPSVTNWFRRLHANENCTQFVHDFLDLIENRMIIVESDQPSSKRASCQVILSTLEDINKKCQADTQYCFKPNPWEPEIDEAADLVAVVVPLRDEARKADLVANRNLRIHVGRTGTVSAALAAPPQPEPTPQ